MHTVDKKALANALLPAVLSAGRLEMGYYASELEVERKADNSPVTNADREAEAILLEALAEIEPEIVVVAEERAADGCVPDIEQAFFLVDPLDGTREFINKRGEFTVNVGLVVDHVPIFGMVYAPALERLFVTIADTSAIEIQIAPDASARTLDDCVSQEIQARPSDHSALVAFASRSHRSEATETFLANYSISETRQAGSSLKFCLIARGDADLYPRIGPTCEWDTAAGHAILSAAGGSVTTLDGAPLPYGKRDQKFLNPHFVAWGKNPPSLPAPKTS